MSSGFRILALAFSILAAGGAPSLLAAGAEVDYDDSVDFSAYRTFRWFGDGRGNRPDRSRGKMSPLVEKDIQQAVESELQAKGLELVDSGQPDLGVVFSTGSRREAVNYGWGPRYRGPRKVTVYREGELTIDLIDGDKRELVWRGSVSATLKEKPEKLKKQIDKSVAKVFKNYPPP